MLLNHHPLHSHFIHIVRLQHSKIITIILCHQGVQCLRDGAFQVKLNIIPFRGEKTFMSYCCPVPLMINCFQWIYQRFGSLWKMFLVVLKGDKIKTIAWRSKCRWVGICALIYRYLPYLTPINRNSILFCL